MNKIWNPAGLRASITRRVRERKDLSRGRTHERWRELLAMERFLARVIAILPDSTVLKGGLALELRLDQARMTKDLDLRMLGDPGELDPQIREIENFRPKPEDYFHFSIKEDGKHPKIIAGKYDGYRYKVKSKLAGKPFASFGLDVAFGDKLFGEPDLVDGSDFFCKYGIPPIRIKIYPAATHLAEKIHAYTQPRGRVNMRMKDLIDMPLLGLALDGTCADQLRKAFSLTFDARDTHPLPDCLKSPPKEWVGKYTELRKQEDLQWRNLKELHAAAAALVSLVLAGAAGS